MEKNVPLTPAGFVEIRASPPPPSLPPSLLSFLFFFQFFKRNGKKICKFAESFLFFVNQKFYKKKTKRLASPPPPPLCRCGTQRVCADRLPLQTLCLQAAVSILTLFLDSSPPDGHVSVWTEQPPNGTQRLDF